MTSMAVNDPNNALINIEDVDDPPDSARSRGSASSRAHSLRSHLAIDTKRPAARQTGGLLKLNLLSDSPDRGQEGISVRDGGSANKDTNDDPLENIRTYDSAEREQDNTDGISHRAVDSDALEHVLIEKAA